MSYASPSDFMNLRPAPVPQRTRVIGLGQLPGQRHGSFDLRRAQGLPPQPTWNMSMPSMPVVYAFPGAEDGFVYKTPLPGRTIERF